MHKSSVVPGSCGKGSQVLLALLILMHISLENTCAVQMP